MVDFKCKSKDESLRSFMDLSNKKNWGIDPAKFSALDIELSKCVEPDGSSLLSFGFRFDDLSYTLYECLRCMDFEAKKLGYGFKDYTRSFRIKDPVTGKLALPLVLRDSVTFLPNDVKIAMLDYYSFWGKPYDKDFLMLRPYWPSFHILLFIILNPTIIPLINGRDLPYIIIPGLVINGHYYLKLGFDGKNLNLSCVWGADSWHDTTLPCYC